MVGRVGRGWPVNKPVCGAQGRRKAQVPGWLVGKWARPVPTEACGQDAPELDSDSAASGIAASCGHAAPVCGSLDHTLGPVGPCLCWQRPPVCPSPPAGPPPSGAHPGRDLPSGDDPPAHGTRVHTDTGALGLPSRTGGQNGREGTVRQATPTDYGERASRTGRKSQVRQLTAFERPSFKNCAAWSHNDITLQKEPGTGGCAAGGQRRRAGAVAGLAQPSPGIPQHRERQTEDAERGASSDSPGPRAWLRGPPPPQAADWERSTQQESREGRRSFVCIRCRPALASLPLPRLRSSGIRVSWEHQFLLPRRLGTAA